MNDRQRMFCHEYVVDWDATAAAKRAGYSPQSAKRHGYQLLQREDVRAYVDALRSDSTRRINLTRDAILQELARLALSDPREGFDKDGNLLPIHEMPEDFRRTVAGWDLSAVESKGEDGETAAAMRLSKVRLRSKEKALELLGKHFRLWDDTPQAPVTLVVRMDGSRDVSDGS